MTQRLAVVTTFPNNSWDIYAKRMLESYAANWPKEIPIMVQLDDGVLAPEVDKIIRSHDGLKCGWEKDHAEFVARNKEKDDPQNYRKQAVRFCHKIFALKYALDSVSEAKKAGHDDVCRYLIWLDADVLTTRKVTLEDIQKCLPNEGDAVSYMGRKDWPHSECGWLVFDLENGGDIVIKEVWDSYIHDSIFKFPEWHDSWVFDAARKFFTENNQTGRWTNLTPEAKGMDVWPQSPMASWSRHYKGPTAKAELSGALQSQKKKDNMQPLKIETCNSIPNENIQRSILENQTQIKNWVLPCKMNDEEIVVVSAGPTLIAEDLQAEIDAGRRIVAVKHAIQPLKEAGIKPWACILLDPRDHVNDFVENPDKDIIWFVASQVTPKAVKTLLDAGCNVWGYHASVGAGEGDYTEKQPHSIVSGGSATATRGLFLLEKLGFHRFRLYGYDLSLSLKPDLSLKDERGQPKNFEIEMGYQLPYFKGKRWFWSTGELLAQADEFRQILNSKPDWEIKAFGNGIVPFLANICRISDLRMKKKLSKMPKVNPIYYEDMLQCKTKTPLSIKWRNMRQKLHLKPKKVSSL